MNKHRWAQLSGMTPEEPVLMLEGNVPFYRDDLKELVQEEIKKALADSNLQADQADIDAARVTQKVATTLGFPGVGFAPGNKRGSSVSRGAGGTIGFGGPGFM